VSTPARPANRAAEPWRERASRRGVKWCAHGDGIIPAWIADMDLPVAEPIREFIRAAAASSDLGYPPRVNCDPLPRVFAERMRQRYGWSPNPQRVELLADIVQGIYIALDRYSAPGDGVLIQTPIYPPFLAAVDETRRRPLLEPLTCDKQGFGIDFARLRARAAEARVLMLCNPHNPTGRVMTRDELTAIAEIAEEHDLIVLADEIHADLAYSGHRHVPFASLGAEVEARTVTFNSAPKAFNTAGIRCAVAAFGSEELHRRFSEVPRRVRGGLGIFATEVTRIAWTECDQWQRSTMATLEANRDHLAARLGVELPALGYRPPEATYLAWLDCRDLDLGARPGGYFLERAGVALEEGERFGEAGRG